MEVRKLGAYFNCYVNLCLNHEISYEDVNGLLKQICKYEHSEDIVLLSKRDYNTIKKVGSGNVEWID